MSLSTCECFKSCKYGLAYANFVEKKVIFLRVFRLELSDFVGLGGLQSPFSITSSLILYVVFLPFFLKIKTKKQVKVIR